MIFAEYFAILAQNCHLSEKQWSLRMGYTYLFKYVLFWKFRSHSIYFSGAIIVITKKGQQRSDGGRSRAQSNQHCCVLWPGHQDTAGSLFPAWDSLLPPGWPGNQHFMKDKPNLIAMDKSQPPKKTSLFFKGILTRESMLHINYSNTLVHSHSETLKLWQCDKGLAILLQKSQDAWRSKSATA